CPSVKPWYQISVRRAKILVHASSGSCLTASTLRFSSGWMMCSPTVDFHHLDKCHAWHTIKRRLYTECTSVFTKFAASGPCGSHAHILRPSSYANQLIALKSIACFSFLNCNSAKINTNISLELK